MKSENALRQELLKAQLYATLLLLLIPALVGQ